MPVHLPSPSTEAAARKRGSRPLRGVNKAHALEVRYKLRAHYPGWATKKEALRAHPR